MKKFALICILFGALLIGCQKQPTETQPAETQPEPQTVSEVTQSYFLRFTDDLDREVVLLEEPKRVAALIGSFADIWCLAGGKDTLVAAADDAFTAFDLDLDDSVARLGAIKSPSLETLLEAEPDFVLASCKTEADVEMMDALEKAQIPVAYFDVSNHGDYLYMFSICTKATKQYELYQKYGTDVISQIEAAVARKTSPGPTVLYVRATGSSCKVKGSEGTVLGEMLKNLGCTNVADQKESLLENLSLEAIMEADPDYIFVVLQGSDSTDAQKSLEQALLSNPAWQTLRAVKEGRFYQLEHSLYNLKPNARWGEAYEKLADILYPKQ